MAAEQGLDQPLLNILTPDGLMLSGGEEQKLLLARAIYKDAPVVILDEPTSALDTLAESQIYEDFSQAMQDKTALFISHRLASSRFCDRILVLVDGRVADFAPHEVLMQQPDSPYARLFKEQAHYFQI
ncbi:ATP-binding cassette domain-containing protein [Oscillospiraceae bacterium HV4-5-C5C]|nr:ATP-binding cassette domain-containing protein [Oscillospiraceae bacterium]MDD4367879.1 ATP-binding cassette domain-containing protein [Oscillospiraceae bacterium]NJP40643.1 ATP-binding cassette domain-containing protein [Oscillospiraceae bacterium HV4-5-C5C]